MSTLPIPAPSGFAVFQLQASLQAAIDALGFHSPTPVQEQVIPQALVGKDLLVSSQTGSGKTAAFLIPLLQGLLSSRNSAMRLPSGPSILVLSPTRELAQQVADDAIDLLKGSRGVRVATVVGCGLGNRSSLFDGLLLLIVHFSSDDRFRFEWVNSQTV